MNNYPDPKKHTRDLQTLRRYHLMAYTISGGMFLFGAIGVILFYNPRIVTSDPSQHHYYLGRPLWAIIGSLMMFFAVWSSITSQQYFRRFDWILKNVRPVSMNFSVEIKNWSDSTDYIIKLFPSEEINAPGWQVSLLTTGSPHQEIKVWAESKQIIPVRVYFDPRRQKPAIIETELGLLWVTIGSGKRLT